MTRPRASSLSLSFLAMSAVLVAGGCSSGGGTAPTPTASPTASPTAEPSSSGSPTESPTTPSTTTVSVYFLAAEKVQPAPRKVTGAGVGAAAVRALLTGPTRSERAQGLSSTIPAGTALNGLDVKDGLATVDLSSRFGSGGGSFSMRARVAEVVFTLTQFPTVDRVLFKLDGKAVTALGGEGLMLQGPQKRSDYESLSPAVLVESPRWGADVRSPQRVTGSANVFEATFFLELRDARGKVLVRQRVTATSGSGTRGTFDVTLRVAGSVDPGPGTLRSFVYSAKDGSREDITSIPVRLVA